MGSGEYMLKELVPYDGQRVLIYFGEMSLLFQKNEARGSTLLTRFLELYDGTESGSGSHANKKWEVKNIHINASGNFTKSSV
jgi:hypothetical protein